jgi:FeS assembly SUF system protein
MPDTFAVHHQREPEGETERNVVEALREIYDPEIPVNIYDLGLIYDIEVQDDGHVDLTMTLTAPNCPAAGTLPGQAEDAAASAEGVTSTELDLTFEPPFTPEMMSDEAKMELGFM